MKLKWTIIIVGVLWIAAITTAHFTLNPNANPFRRQPENYTADGKRKFKVGFLPVTCHLTCPVTDFINTSMTGEGMFQPIRFHGWPELKEAFLSGDTDATFILAPMAMTLREEGVNVRIVYLGHRDGTAMMVHKDSGIDNVRQLRGKKVAVPAALSNQRLLLMRALKQQGMSIDDVYLMYMAPPDMPQALEHRYVDAISSGEPFMGQTELDGYGKILYLTKDVWPGFISCVLAVREDTIENHRDAVQQLVQGIAKSGKWIDQGPDHREQAAQFVSKNYYNQDPRLLSFVLSKPPDRVKYTNLSVRRQDFEEIQALAVEAEIMKGTVDFDDYCDPSFVPDDATIEAWTWEGK